MGEEGHFIIGIDPPRPGKRRRRVAGRVRFQPRPCRIAAQLCPDRRRTHPGVRPLVPIDLQRLQPLQRRPHMVADDGDKIVENDDLSNSRHGPRRRLVDPGDRAAKHRRLGQRRDTGARNPHIDAVNGAAVDLRRRVEALCRCTDQAEIAVGLQCCRFRRRHHRGRGRRQRAIIEPASAGVDHHAIVGFQRRRIDRPAIRRRRDDQRPGIGAGLAQDRNEPGADRRRAAGALALARTTIKHVIGRRIDDRNLRPVAIEFFRNDLAVRGVDALSHFLLRHYQRHAAVGIKADEGVGRERRLCRTRR